MGTVTRIRTVKLPQEKTYVYLDGTLTFTLPSIVATDLQVGKTLTDEESKLYENYSRYFACMSAAKQLLTQRQHGKAELKTKLKKKYPAEAVDLVMDDLIKLGLVNDSEFASFYVDNCNTCRPKGKALITSELKRKGVSAEAIQQSRSGVDEEDNAYRAACRRAERLAPLGKREFSQKLYAFLSRRGFKYEVISHTIERLWEENKNTENQEEYEYQPYEES